jgi:hypothetical protein
MGAKVRATPLSPSEGGWRLFIWAFNKVGLIPTLLKAHINNPDLEITFQYLSSRMYKTRRK